MPRVPFPGGVEDDRAYTADTCEMRYQRPGTTGCLGGGGVIAVAANSAVGQGPDCASREWQLLAG